MQALNVGKYVAFGDSITSGYADAALFTEAQRYSYGNLIATQMAGKNKPVFNQPLMPDDSVGIAMFGHSKMVMQKRSFTSGYAYDRHIIQHPGDLKSLSEYIFPIQGPFHNIGVPGAKITTSLYPGFGNPGNGPGNFNPFFTRMAANPAESSMIKDALALKPEFFTLFIGNNDTLTYALSGGTTDKITPVHGEPGFGFDGSLHALVQSFLSVGAKGAIATLPCITTIPFFTAIPVNAMKLSSEEELSHCRSLFPHLAGQLKLGNNPFILEENGISRLAFPDEMICLEALMDSDAPKFLHGKLPLPKRYFLNSEQKNTIIASIAAYNEVIVQVCEQYQLALTDVHHFLKTLDQDTYIHPNDFFVYYKSRAVFSLDGLHLSQFGQALLANMFIKSLNERYHTGIPHVNLFRFKGNEAYQEEQDELRRLWKQNMLSFSV